MSLGPAEIEQRREARQDHIVRTTRHGGRPRRFRTAADFTVRESPVWS